VSPAPNAAPEYVPPPSVTLTVGVAGLIVNEVLAVLLA